MLATTAAPPAPPGTGLPCSPVCLGKGRLQRLRFSLLLMETVVHLVGFCEK